METDIDQAQAIKLIAEEQPVGAWAHVVAACEYNGVLGDRVLGYLAVDWKRTSEKLGLLKRIDNLFVAAFCWEWWAVVVYRLSYWTHARRIPYMGRWRVLQWLLLMQQATLLRFCFTLGKLAEGLSGARISALAEIGPGFLLIHSGSCGIGSGVRIGDWFSMYQDSSVLGYGTAETAPVLGKGVTLYSGARVVGPVTVGDNVRVGANALVRHDLPGNCLAVGVPARPLVTGEPAPDYPASTLVRDVIATLVEAGQLREIGPNRFRDTATGEELELLAR